MRQMISLKNNKEAFSFIELLITLVVLSICLLPLLNMFSHFLQQTTYTSDLTTARYLAQEGMEKVKNNNFTVEQLKKIGDLWEPPINEKPFFINGSKWRVRRKLDLGTAPLTVYIQVFKDENMLKGQDQVKPFLEIVTLIEDFEW